MKYEYRKGDKLRVIDGSGTGGVLEEGMIVEVLLDLSTDIGSTEVHIRTPDGIESTRYVSRFVKCETNEKPKVLVKPTHIVIWNEDRDPCKFFTNLIEAEKFIKELTEKPNVKKDSIILVEIKSAKSITIQKSIRKSDYKM